MRLSRHLDELKPAYDAVVVGSGYGAGVAASRLARMGLSVAVLERGREIPIGEFPDTLPEAAGEFQYTLEGVHQGRRTGLYDLHFGHDMHVLVGCGLGGTSLINANVSLPPDVRVWEDRRWPAELFADERLNEGFARATTMLRPKAWDDRRPLAKLDRLKEAAARLDSELTRPPINVAFEAGTNAAGVHQPACTLCGDCCSGCNVGAKTTVQMTYLPDAYLHGAEIFTEATVRHVAKQADGSWRIFYVVTNQRRDGFRAPERSVSARMVVLGAGSLGSTEILLRSREQGLAVSGRLGANFTGNGDVLAFAWNGQKAANAVGIGEPPKANVDAPGPCITGAIDLRDTGQLEDGMIIEEGVLPSGLAEILPGIFNVGGKVFGRDTTSGMLDEFQEAVRRSESWLLGSWRGAMSHTSTFLVMAHDGAQGELRLHDDRIRVDWPEAASQSVYRNIDAKLLEASAANSATFIRNPLQSTFLGKTLISVHPLGGCGMGRDRAQGVVDHRCRVFDGAGASPTMVHEGLYVVDGAMLPRSVGVNPLLTISALAERAMMLLADDIGKPLDVVRKLERPVLHLTGAAKAPSLLTGLLQTARKGISFTDVTGAAIAAQVEEAARRGKAALGLVAGAAGAARDAATTANPASIGDAGPRQREVAGVEFTERMAGYVSDRSEAGYEAATTVGRSFDSAFAFTVTVRIDDMARFLADPEHPGTLSGTAECKALSPDPLDITGGTFSLMRKSSDSPETRLFEYRMQLNARDGRHYEFEGVKYVHDDHRPSDLWKDTTTLFVDVRDPSGMRAGLRGMLSIAPLDFARQLRTLRGTGGSGPERAAAVASFGTLFAGTLYDVYGDVLAPAKRFNPARARKKRGLRAGTPEVHAFATADGKTLRLTRYTADGRNTKGPVLLTHGLGVSSLIFSIDTIETNLVEYLTDRGFDCWLLDFRASIDLPYHRERWSADECARFDYQPAVDLIRHITGAASVQVIAHCFGATTFTMSVLGGHLTGVRSAVISQIAADILVPFWPQRFLAFLRTPQLLDALGVSTVNARATTEDGALNRVIDGVIRLMAPFRREGIGRNATSNRITALYGELYRTEQLDTLTFDSGLPEMFGEANIDAFKHLSLLARKTVLLDRRGEDLYMPHLDRLAFPIAFIHGAENRCFRPESTARTLEKLVARNGARLYTRHLIPNYGHIDCIFGKNAASDVYPKIHEHLERTL